MKEQNLRGLGIAGYGQQFGLSLGTVMNNADPAHHGRLQIFVPAWDSEDFETDDLPWCWYISPAGGSTADFKVGREQVDVPGITTYGMWTIPKNGAKVLVGCLDGNPEQRFWIGCFFMPEHNRTMPAGIDGLKTEIDESGVYGQHEIQHYKDNLTEAGLYKTDKHFRTRGGYERSISHPSNKNKDKPTDNGYAPKPLDPKNADSQTHVWQTPGRHYILFSDVDEYCRLRLRTTEGNQIIFDDTNERIYLSTAKGRNWVELDEGSGKVYVYSTSKINIKAENDINLYSSENINIVAKKRVNIKSEERGVKVQAKMNIEAVSEEGNIKATASRDIHLKTVNGPAASEVRASVICSKPPYAGKPLGVITDWAEEAGSQTSSVFIEAYQNMELSSKSGFTKLTAKGMIDVKSISSTIKLTSNNSLTLLSERDSLIFSTTKDLSLLATGSLQVSGRTVDIVGSSTVTLSANSDLNLLASNMYTNIAGGTGLKTVDDVDIVSLGDSSASPVTARAGSAASIAASANAVKAEQVKPKMIIPEHESWVRDEDEAICPTKRNKKYQG